MGHIVKIGRYEIIDAELDAQNVETVSIPCQTNPDLSYQLVKPGYRHGLTASLSIWPSGIMTNSRIAGY